MDTDNRLADSRRFSGYQTFVAGSLAFLQFAVILDFMIISPLGALIMPALDVSPRQFGLIVSAYAFSAGVSGVLTAGFADRFDRKRILLFYTGFLGGTLWCGFATSFEMLLVARIVTGLFGGVIGSIVLAIATDLFADHLRGRVIGWIQTALSASQILGLPVGLYLSNQWGWHAPFFAIVLVGITGGLIITLRLNPINGHLAMPNGRNAFRHLASTVSDARYLTAFATTGLATAGGYLLMPFMSTFTVRNIGIDVRTLPMIYMVTGICSIVTGPIIGKAADRLGKMRMFLFGCTIFIVMVLLYTHLGTVPLPLLMAVNAILFIGIFARMIPLQALLSSIPGPNSRGSFNAINSASQQLAGGIASVVAGHLISVGVDGKMVDVPVVGYIVVATTIISAMLLWRLQFSKAKQV